MREHEVSPLPEDALGVPDAARLIGRRPGFLYRRIMKRKVRAWRVGGTALVVSRRDVLALVEELRRAG